jgi:hypothetical protein
VTVNLVGLRTVPVGAAVLTTLIGPVVAVAGTVAFSWVEETTVVAAAVPWNLAVELELKPIPLIVTTVPPGPLEGLKPVIARVGVKFAALEALPALSDTEMLPAAASPLGTTARSWVVDTKLTAGDLSVPNLTVIPGTNLVPVIVTVLPVIPEEGVKELSVGGP